MNATLLGTLLTIPVPPQLAAAIGYHGDARYFALYWTAAGDEAMVTDGRVTHDGCWWGYQAFVDHPAIALPLARAGHRYDLGSSEEMATHWLVIDREIRTASIAPVHDAEAFLDAQHPPLPKIELTPEQWNAFAHGWERIARQALAETAARLASFDPMAALAEQNAIVTEMKTWLDAQLPIDWDRQLLRQLGGRKHDENTD